MTRLRTPRRRPGRDLALLAFALLPSAAAAQSQPEGDGPWMVRAFFGDAAMKRAVASWGEHFADLEERGYLQLEADARRLAALRSLGFYVEVDDERTAWMREGERAAREAAERGGAPLAGIPGFPCYRTVEESFAAMQALATAHPTLASIVDAGDSWQKAVGPEAGWDMQVLKLTNAAIAGPKPKLFVTSSIHAREYAPAELALRFGEELANGYGVDAEATWLLDEHEVHLMVHANPDGRKQAESGLLWRKNVDNDHCTGSNNRGVDLNRNFGFFWASCAPELGCSSSSPCSETFRGPSAASEPEIQAIQGHILASFPDQRGPLLTDPAPADATGVYLDIHSFGQLILTPWGFQDPNVAPAPNGVAFRTGARKFARLSGYDPSLFIYEVDGASADFGYGELGIAASAWEIGTAFFESCPSFEANIVPSGLPMLRYAAKMARTPFLTPAGPDVTAVDEVIALPGGSTALAATVSDDRFSSENGVEPIQPIAAAEAYLDLPPWRAGAVPIALAALDGAFDEVEEAVGAEIGIDESTPAGPHLVYVRAQDASGAWGAPTATFLTVLDPETAPSVSGFVLEAGSDAPLAATVRVGPFATATDPATGAFEIRVPPGSYDLRAEAPDHQAATVPGVELEELENLAQDFHLVRLSTLLASDGETGAAGWTAQSPWALTTEAAASPTHSWTDSPGANYAANANTSLTSPVLDLSLATAVGISFRDLRDLEEGWDFGRLEVSTGGGWTQVASWDGEGLDTVWRDVELELPQLAGAATARIRFRLTADSLVQLDGWHVDDIVVRAAMPADYLFVDGFESGATYFWSETEP